MSAFAVRLCCTAVSASTPTPVAFVIVVVQLDWVSSGILSNSVMFNKALSSFCWCSLLCSDLLSLNIISISNKKSHSDEQKLPCNTNAGRSVTLLRVIVSISPLSRPFAFLKSVFAHWCKVILLYSFPSSCLYCCKQKHLCIPLAWTQLHDHHNLQQHVLGFRQNYRQRQSTRLQLSHVLGNK